MAARAEPRGRPAGRLPGEVGCLAAGAAPGMKCVTADGRKLTYRSLGNGPVLVCHPGGPGLSSAYFGDLAGLWERFTLIEINPRGTGTSDRPKDRRAYQVDDYVSDVEELRHHLGLDRIRLLGHSHGGVVAHAYASKHPDRVSRLVLASTLARFGPEQDKALTLVITGDEDFICGPVCADDLCAAIASAKRVIVGDSGHMIFVEQPQAFHDEVADFLTP